MKQVLQKHYVYDPGDLVVYQRSSQRTLGIVLSRTRYAGPGPMIEPGCFDEWQYVVLLRRKEKLDLEDQVWWCQLEPFAPEAEGP